MTALRCMAGMARPGWAGLGSLGMARQCWSRHGSAGRGTAWQAWLGKLEREVKVLQRKYGHLSEFSEIVNRVAKEGAA